MFGFMLDETETRETVGKAVACRACHIRLASKAPRVVVAEETYHRDCFEAAHKKRTGKRPTLVPCSHGERVTFRPAGPWMRIEGTIRQRRAS